MRGEHDIALRDGLQIDCVESRLGFGKAKCRAKKHQDWTVVVRARHSIT